VFNKKNCGSLDMMAHHKVVHVVVEARVLVKPIIMESDKVQSIFLHGNYVNTRLF